MTQDTLYEELERPAVISLYVYLLLYEQSMYHVIVIYYVLTYIIALTLQSSVLCLSGARCITVYRFSKAPFCL